MEPPKLQSVKTVLIANRGEIAVRCIRACRAAGATSVSIYTKSDAGSLHATSADVSVLLDNDGSSGYLEIDNIIRICRDNSVDAVLPGYGFLSENVKFAKAVTDAGMIFAGPSSESIIEMGLKHRAREVAISANVPVVPGTDLLDTEGQALAEAERLTYPVMLKATGGGGGMGLQICHSPAELGAAFTTVRSRGEQVFRNSGVLLEKYYSRSRHIEVQVFGNGTDTIHFGERECSIQRRHQKVIEECPSPFVDSRPELRKRLTECATRYASTLNYKSAGTVEFLVDDDTGDFFFLEMNTRLQVEHGITEMCYSVDLVLLMLWQADMEKAGKGGIPSAELQRLVKPEPSGAAIECRVYAENPDRNFAPSPGVFQEVSWPEGDGVRIDTWVGSGQEVSLHYDPLVAKAMVHAPTRTEAIGKMNRLCSRDIVLKGPVTNLQFLDAVITSDSFKQGDTLTNFLDVRFKYQSCGIDIVDAGPYSTIQDFPARSSVGHGVPKSGPMDNVSSRIANQLVHNQSGVEVIEITLSGPELLFTASTLVAVCGADAPVTIDGGKKPMWSTLVVRQGQTLKIGAVAGAGCRVYLAVHGGFPNIPVVLGSKSTTPSLKFGGNQGRTLRNGDFLQLDEKAPSAVTDAVEYSLPPAMIPNINVQEIYVMQGPHDSGEIMTDKDRDMLYNTEWKVDHNSSRAAVRLLGPAPEWARTSGGEAGSHPSNYLDYGYPTPGGMNWGGNSPCLFSVDSPSFGGLICSHTVVSSELWKLGQLRPGARFRMTPVSLDQAVRQIRRVNQYIASVEDNIRGKSNNAPVQQSEWKLSRAKVEASSAILKTIPKSQDNPLRPKVVYRQGGDRFLLLEFGEQSTDIAIVARIRVLIEKLEEQSDMNLSLTPHVGSLNIEYNPLEISQAQLLERVLQLESNIEPTIDFKIPCREFRLPLVLDHPDMAECTQRYIETARNKAAYLPDNLDYVRKANGLASRRAVFDLLLETNYLVAAVGFLCGCPMLMPLSPKRLEGQKYNPTRATTPGGTIGMGGSILVGYTTEQPGGYMMLARTLEMWDPFGSKPGFDTSRSWLFEPFDKLKFYEVGVEEYDSLARDFAAGRYEWQVSPSTFDVREAYEQFQDELRSSETVAYREGQRRGLAEQDKLENELYTEWKAEVTAAEDANEDSGASLQDDVNTVAVSSPMAANVWKVEVSPGDVLKAGQTVAILEAMKMEVNVSAPQDADGCTVQSILKKPNSMVTAGDVIVVARRDT